MGCDTIGLFDVDTPLVYIRLPTPMIGQEKSRKVVHCLLYLVSSVFFCEFRLFVQNMTDDLVRVQYDCSRCIVCVQYIMDSHAR